jgi:hypothetical protein
MAFTPDSVEAISFDFTHPQGGKPGPKGAFPEPTREQLQAFGDTVNEVAHRHGHDSVTAEVGQVADEAKGDKLNRHDPRRRGEAVRRVDHPRAARGPAATGAGRVPDLRDAGAAGPYVADTRYERLTGGPERRQLAYLIAAPCPATRSSRR